MVDCACGSEQLLSPRDRLVLLDAPAEECCVNGDVDGEVEIAAIGCPPERRAQVR